MLPALAVKCQCQTERREEEAHFDSDFQTLTSLSFHRFNFCHQQMHNREIKCSFKENKIYVFQRDVWNQWHLYTDFCAQDRVISAEHRDPGE